MATVDGVAARERNGASPFANPGVHEETRLGGPTALPAEDQEVVELGETDVEGHDGAASIAK